MILRLSLNEASFAFELIFRKLFKIYLEYLETYVYNLPLDYSF
jgi:hypothetical protein